MLFLFYFLFLFWGTVYLIPNKTMKVNKYTVLKIPCPQNPKIRREIRPAEGRERRAALGAIPAIPSILGMVA